MSYRKLIDVHFDSDRVYFTFYLNGRKGGIIGLPQSASENQSIYFGKDFNFLSKIEPTELLTHLPEIIQSSLKRHPALANCDIQTVKKLLL